MQVTETLSDGLRRGFAIVVPAADIEGKRSQRLAEISKTVNMPGFRPGKVPLSIVKQRYGMAVMSEVLEESVNSATQQMLSERGLRAVGQPKIEVTKVADKQDLEFTVELELLPEITMPDFAALQLTQLKAEPTAEAIELALGEIAKNQKDWEPVTDDRGAQTGDQLTVDFVGKVDGVPFSGGTGTAMPVELGADGFIPGFSEGMAGMKSGEQRTIEVTFPEQYHSAELAGKAATFDLNATALAQPKVAGIDDALATKLGFESLDQLRERVTTQIQREYDRGSRMRLKRVLLDQLAQAATFPVPPSMVEGEFAAIWSRVEQDRKSGQGDPADATKDDETLRAEYRGIAERRVRLGLLLSEIGRANGIQVGADEMQRAMRQEATRYPGQELEVIKFFTENQQAADTLRGPLYEEKVVDFILELAQVEQKTVTAEELAEDPVEAQPPETQPPETQPPEAQPPETQAA